MGNITRKALKICEDFGEIEKKAPRFTFTSYKLENIDFSKEDEFKSEGEYSFEDENIIYHVKKLIDQNHNVCAVMSDDGYKWKLYSFSDDTKNKYIYEEPKKTESKSGCFIATAVYSSPYENEVMVLKDFRDNWLMKYKFGRTFIKLYYWFSPPLANQIAKSNSLRKITKSFLIIPLLKFANSVKSKEK